MTSPQVRAMRRAAYGRPEQSRRGLPNAARMWMQTAPSQGHPLADASTSGALLKRASEINEAFTAIEPVLRDLAPRQFSEGFAEDAHAVIKARLALDVPLDHLAATWTQPLDVPALYAHCVLGTFCRLVDHSIHEKPVHLSDGESAETLIRRWGFHAVDITPCADGRLSGVVDYILRVPQEVVVSRRSHAGSIFDVEDTLRRWEAVELRRWRDGKPNPVTEPTRYLKIGVYHFSSLDPEHQGCAAHGSDTARAAAAVLERLERFETAVHATHEQGADIATLLVGVDTDTDAIRVHVPDVQGRMSIDGFADSLALYESTLHLGRDAAKDAIRDAVAQCAGVASDDLATEGMRWFCGYLLKNNIAQVDAVRALYAGGAYTDRGHTERLIVVGDAVDDVQLRNLAFQAQLETVEAGAEDLAIGVKILSGLHEPQGLAIPVLAHFRYDPRIPGARERAQARAQRLRSAILARYTDLAVRGAIHVHSVVRGGDGPMEELS